MPPGPFVGARLERRQSGGVNLVGFVRGQLGLGEDVRMAAAALQATGIPHALINVPAGVAVPQKDASLEHMLTERLPYDVTIYCMSAFDMAVLYLARGPGFFAGRSPHRLLALGAAKLSARVEGRLYAGRRGLGRQHIHGTLPSHAVYQAGAKTALPSRASPGRAGATA